MEEETVQPRVVLVVPKQYVKTVKSALERAGRLDRSSKIIPEPQAESGTNTNTALQQPSQDEREPNREGTGPSQKAIEASVSGATHQQGSSAQQPRFLVLEFDVISGEYVDPSVLDNRNRSRKVDEQQDTSSTPGRSPGRSQTQNPFPRLQFDVASGEYADSSAIGSKDCDEDEVEKKNSVAPAESPRDSNTQTPFPRLHFDPDSGEYVDASVLQARGQQPGKTQGDMTSTPVLPSGDTQTDAAFPRLHFDVVSGQYVDQSTIEKRDRGLEEMGQQRMRIPTTVPYRSTARSSSIADLEEAHDVKAELLDDLTLSHLSKSISISYHIPSTTSDGSPVSKSPVHRALKVALDALPDHVLTDSGLTPEALVSAFPDGYSIYKPMLLLPHNAFSAEVWRALLSTNPITSSLLQPLWLGITEAVGAKHMAINSPIPLQSTTTPTETVVQENILRRPSNLSPIYGDFGSAPTPQTLSFPTPCDFESALWVETKQNGIWQTWAPLYTMFSRGNVREKTRVLQHPAIARDFDVPSAAVDLYSGIGYFAFSYKKSGEGRDNGIKQVLCWELNPWSVEGLRRGAEMNGWTCCVIKKEDITGLHGDNTKKSMQNEDFIVFQMSNEDAESVYASMAESLPGLPIRHVNLGLLPHSKLSWSTAVAVMDAERGGWIHAHENVGIKDIDSRTVEVETEFQNLSDAQKEQEKDKKVTVGHVERVKMYAPGVVHCVFDIAIVKI
jgi:tRNA wybutosine-synthesizing protein 2